MVAPESECYVPSMALRRKVVAGGLGLVALSMVGPVKVWAQAPEPSSSTTSSTVSGPVPDTTAACPQPYEPLGWTFQPSAGSLVSHGFVGPVAGTEVLGIFGPPSIPGPPNPLIPAGALYGGQTIDLPESASYSLLVAPGAQGNAVVWLVNVDAAIPFLAPGSPTVSTGEGRVRAVDAGSAGLFLEVQILSRSGTWTYLWRFDDPCAGPPTAAASAVGAVPAFTG
jgi:hypothetical protein